MNGVIYSSFVKTGPLGSLSRIYLALLTVLSHAMFFLNTASNKHASRCPKTTPAHLSICVLNGGYVAVSKRALDEAQHQ